MMRHISPTDLIDILDRCAEFLDNYVDVNDGDDGQPVPNLAMSLKADVEAGRDAVQQQIHRENNEH